MAKVSKYGESLWFWCEGCQTNHRFTLDRWTWDGSFDKPTFSPSLISDPDGPRRCHLHVRGGKIEYLSDCHNELRGKTIEMEDLEDTNA